MAHLIKIHFKIHLLVVLLFCSCQNRVAENAPQVPSSALPTPLGPGQFIFAGISGLPPRYLESGPNQGLGWVENETLEIRKGLKEDGFTLVQEWMSPARIDHEFQKKNPICTYPVVWSHPEQIFSENSKTPPSKIYSIALDYEEEANHGILFKKENLPKFKKYIDSKGDISIDRLLEDKSLKMILVRNQDYGVFTSRLTEKDAKGDQAVKLRYQTHVSLLFARENRQLIEMLNADRFDYLFAESIEEQDFQEAKLRQDQFLQLNYDTSRVKDLKDPALRQISIACSIHPVTLAAMPYINKWIQINRGHSWKSKKTSYRNKLDTKYANAPDNSRMCLAARFQGQLKDGSSDAWYSLQLKQVPGLKLFPDPIPVGQLPKLTSKKYPLLWHALEYDDNGVALLDESQLYRRSPFDSDLDERRRSSNFGNASYPWSHTRLDEVLPEALKMRLLEFNFETHRSGWADLKSIQLGSKKIKHFTLFASGLNSNSLEPLMERLKAQGPVLQSLSVFDAAPEVMQRITSILPSSLVSLNLTNSSLSTISPQVFQTPFPNLQHLHLSSTQLGQKNLERLIRNLPPSLKSLSLGSQPNSWNLTNAALLGKKRFPQLKRIDLSNNLLGREALTLIAPLLNGVTAEILLGGNLGSIAEIVSRISMAPTGLNLMGLRLYDAHPMQLPPSLRSLNLFDMSLDVERSVLPTRLQNLGTLETLTLGSIDSHATYPGKVKLFSHLANRVSNLTLSNMKVGLEDLRALVSQTSISHIEQLDLSGNNLGDDAIEILTQARFTLGQLNLDNNFIQNRGVALISKKWLKQLKGLSLNSNPINEIGIKSLAEALPEGLLKLDLASVLSLDVPSLAEHFPKSLRKLNLSGNQLTESELKALAPKLPSGLFELNLEGSAFGTRGAWTLSEHMPPHLASLNLKGVPIGSEGLEILSTRLPPTLTELKLGQITIHAPAALALAQNMPPRLRRLELETVVWDTKTASQLIAALPRSVSAIRWIGVPIGAEGATSFSRNWPTNLRQLDLMGAKLGDSGAIALSQGFSPAVEALQLQGDEMGDAGMSAFSQLPLENVFYLNLGQNSFGAKGLRALNARPRNFKGFEFNSSQVDVRGMRDFGPNLLNNLRRLYLGNHNWNNESVIELVRKLHPETQALEIPSVGLTYEGIEELVRALPRDLLRLSISGNAIGEKGIAKIQNEIRRREQAGFGFLLIK